MSLILCPSCDGKRRCRTCLSDFCYADGCVVPIKWGNFMCRKHWRRVPRRLQKYLMAPCLPRSLAIELAAQAILAARNFR